MPIITLTTDFGYQDSYVGEMKGAILSIAPKANLVDLSHAIKPQAIEEAAWVIKQAAQTFPKGTVHLVVVDPGVGTKRRLLAVKTSQAFFIAPDNGVLSYVLEEELTFEIRSLTNSHFFSKQVSATFHGRDILGPVAGHLIKNKAVFSRLGPAVSDPVKLPLKKVMKTKTGFKGQVIHVDHFGNLITNIHAKEMKTGSLGILRIKGKKLLLQRTYGSVKKGTLLALAGSSGYVEVACSGGSAARRLHSGFGDPVLLEFL